MTEALIDSLACYRLTRLVVADTIFDRPRDRLVESLEAAGYEKLVTLLACPWCVSVYAGFGIVTLRRYAPKWWGPVASALAFAAVAGLLSGHEEG